MARTKQLARGGQQNRLSLLQRMGMSGPEKAKAEKNKKKQHKRRYRSGTVAVREIRRYQRSTHTLMRKLPFARLVREIAQDFKNDLRFTKEALEVLQEASEKFMVDNFTNAQTAASFNKSVTLMPRHFNLAMFLTEPELFQTRQRMKLEEAKAKMEKTQAKKETL